MHSSKKLVFFSTYAFDLTDVVLHFFYSAAVDFSELRTRELGTANDDLVLVFEQFLEEGLSEVLVE